MIGSAQISRRLQAALIVTLVFCAVELAAGFYANSLALLSDAAHNFTDVVALGLSAYALYLGSRPADPGKTYGYHRAGILVALFNASTLIAIAAVILYEALRRLAAPPEIEDRVLIVVAAAAFVLNTGVALALHHLSATDLNVQSAFVHIVGDALASVGVVVAGVAIAVTGWWVLDPLASMAVALLIAVSSWSILREGVNILLEGTPKGVDLDAMVRDVLQVEGVHGVHDLHVWSITADLHALSAHVLTDNVSIRRGAEIQRAINSLLVTHYDIAHTALQLECEGCDPDQLYCELGADGRKPETIGGDGSIS